MDAFPSISVPILTLYVVHFGNYIFRVAVVKWLNLDRTHGTNSATVRSHDL